MVKNEVPRCILGLPQIIQDSTRLVEVLSISLWTRAVPADDMIIMMTSSNGNIFRVTGHCAGNSPVTGEFPVQRPVTRGVDALFDLRLDKRLNKQSWGWWFETPSGPLWRHRNDWSVIWILVIKSARYEKMMMHLQQCPQAKVNVEW